MPKQIQATTTVKALLSPRGLIQFQDLREGGLLERGA